MMAKIAVKPIIEEPAGKPLGYTEIFTAFVMYGIGIGTTLGFYLVEIISYKLKKET